MLINTVDAKVDYWYFISEPYRGVWKRKEPNDSPVNHKAMRKEIIAAQSSPNLHQNSKKIK